MRPKKRRLYHNSHWILGQVKRMMCKLPNVFAWPRKSNMIPPMTSPQTSLSVLQPHRALCARPLQGCAPAVSFTCPALSPDLPIPGSCHSHLNLSHLLRDAFPHHTKGARAQLAPLHRPALFSSLHLPHRKLFTYFLIYGLPPVRTDTPGELCLSAFTQI